MNSKNISIKVENWDNNTVWFDDVNLSSSDTSEQVTFLYPDHLGRPVSGNFDYLPFGAIYQGTSETNLRFPGQYQDRVDLYQNGFRDYNPRLGRYMEADPIGQWSDVNLYPYVGNNAMNYTDQSGLASVTNLTDHPIWASGNRGLLGGLGLQVGFYIKPNETVNIFYPKDGVGDVDQVEGKKIPGYSFVPIVIITEKDGILYVTPFPSIFPNLSRRRLINLDDYDPKYLPKREDLLCPGETPK